MENKDKMAVKTTVRCPKCGTSFVLPDHEHVQCGTVIAKDSNLGTVFLKADESENNTNSLGYVQSMPKRGPDGKFLPRGCNIVEPSNTDGANARRCPRNNKSGVGCEYCDKGICRAVCYATYPPQWDPCVYAAGQPDNLGDDGFRLSDRILDGGYVKNHRLFRRWIMAQMFHLIRDERSYKGYTERIRERGVRYMWKVVKNEFHDMAAIKRNGDAEEFKRRFRWWNDDLVIRIGDDFVKQIDKLVARMPKHKCKGRPYVRVPGFGNVFCDEWCARVTNPIKNAIRAIDASGFDPDCVAKLCDLCSVFKEGRYFGLKMPTVFINAFKGAGAYFTLRNMLMFHGCTLPEKVVEKYGEPAKGLRGLKKQLAVLDAVAKNFEDGEGWQLMGLLRDTIGSNGIDVAKKIESWKK